MGYKFLIALAKTCAVKVCRIISNPSSELMVIIDTSESVSIGSHKSICDPFTTTATAALARPGPMSLAKSNPVEP